MKLNKNIMALATAAAFGISGQAFAGGTTAGTDITNAVTLDFQVGGTNQVQLSDDTTFRVDNRIDMTMIDNTAPGNTTAPGATETYTFSLKNDGNKDQTFQLALAVNTGSSSTDITLPTVTYTDIDSGATGSLAGNLFTVPVDATVNFTAQFTFPTQTTAPANIEDTDVFNILATATAVESNGDPITPDVATDKNDPANIALKELVVFAEDASTDSVVYDGVISVLASTTIATAALEDGSGNAGPSITVKVLNDTICNTDNSAYTVGTVFTCTATDAPAGYTPKAIPLALVEYTITTVNSSTTTDASHLQFAHTLPTEEATLANVLVKVNGATQTGTYTYDDGTGSTTYNVNDSSISALAVNVESLPAGETAVITFTAIIQ
mgnify:CR=1 FL=1